MLSLLETAAPLVAIRSTPLLYATLNALHILGLGLLIGSIAAFDLATLGLWRLRPDPGLWRLAAVGLGVALATGAVLLSLRAAHYLSNPVVQVKLALVVAGIINATLFHRARSSGAGARRVKAGACMSLALWIAALFAGRWIAFSG